MLVVFLAMCKVNNTYSHINQKQSREYVISIFSNVLKPI